LPENPGRIGAGLSIPTACAVFTRETRLRYVLILIGALAVAYFIGLGVRSFLQSQKNKDSR